MALLQSITTHLNFKSVGITVESHMQKDNIGSTSHVFQVDQRLNCLKRKLFSAEMEWMKPDLPETTEKIDKMWNKAFKTHTSNQGQWSENGKWDEPANSQLTPVRAAGGTRRGKAGNQRR